MFVGALGYADDILLLCPTRDGLQKMLKTCEDFAEEHLLKFSTHDEPNKSKTKCLKYEKKVSNIAPVQLCEKDLPWVDQGKHLGNIIENNINGMKKDLQIKRARYIEKNNTLEQEFHFAHPIK